MLNAMIDCLMHERGTIKLNVRLLVELSSSEHDQQMKEDGLCNGNKQPLLSITVS